MARIPVSAGVAIDDGELVFEFQRAAGPGGQNVNKVATAVRLYFDARNSPSLPAGMRERLLKLAGRRADDAGVIGILARRHRTQEGNRRDALERLLELLRESATPPRPRKKTRPTAGSRERRLEGKRVRSKVKSVRRTRPDADD